MVWWVEYVYIENVPINLKNAVLDILNMNKYDENGYVREKRSAKRQKVSCY